MNPRGMVLQVKSKMGFLWTPINHRRMVRLRNLSDLPEPENCVAARLCPATLFIKIEKNNTKPLKLRSEMYFQNKNPGKDLLTTISPKKKFSLREPQGGAKGRPPLTPPRASLANAPKPTKEKCLLQAA